MARAIQRKGRNHTAGARPAITEALEGRLLLSSDPTLGDLAGHITTDPAHSSTVADLSGFTVFVDDNSNGILDADEHSAVSDARGAFSIPDLTPGQHPIAFIPPAATWKSVGTTPTSENIQANATNTIWIPVGDFACTIQGSVYQDLNGNHTPDSGEGRAGFVVYDDFNLNDKLDPGEASTTTDANGNYQLTTVINGWHALIIIPKKGWDVGQFRFPYHDSAPVAVTDQPVTYNLPIARLATVSGVVFDDRNYNGVRDKNEPLLAKQTIQFTTFYQDADVAYRQWTVKTDATGHYTAPVPCQLLKIVLLPPKGRKALPGTYDGTPTDGSSFKVAFGTTDRVLIQTGVFRTALRDVSGVSFPIQQYLGGWEIFIDDNNNGRLDLGERSLVTRNGAHSTFPALAPGKYVIRVIPRKGFALKNGSVKILNLKPGDEILATFAVM